MKSGVFPKLLGVSTQVRLCGVELLGGSAKALEIQNLKQIPEGEQVSA
jgi:hypothetical protein